MDTDIFDVRIHLCCTKFMIWEKFLTQAIVYFWLVSLFLLKEQTYLHGSCV